MGRDNWDMQHSLEGEKRRRVGHKTTSEREQGLVLRLEKEFEEPGHWNRMKGCKKLTASVEDYLDSMLDSQVTVLSLEDIVYSVVVVAI